MDKYQSRVLGKYRIWDYELGKGSNSKVFYGQELGPVNHRVAVKLINKKILESEPVKKKQQSNEVANLKLLNSPYIVKLYDCIEEGDFIYIILEFCQDGDLNNHIKNRGGSLTDFEGIVLLRHVVEGFKVLQQHKIIHRDIKPANILMSQSTAKIADFGFSRLLQNLSQPKTLTLLGSPLYTAPEVLMMQRFNDKCDVWSMGIVLYEMLYGKRPWVGDSIHQLRQNIFRVPLEFNVQGRNEALKSLITRMLAIDYAKRISWNEIFQYPLMKDNIVVPVKSDSTYEDVVATFTSYLKQELVAGYLHINIQAAQEVERSCQITAECPEIELAKFNQERQKMLKIFIIIIHERNLAFFFSYLLGLLYKFKDKSKFLEKLHKYGEIEFVICKIACDFIQDIANKYYNPKNSSGIPEIEWNAFKSTQQYGSIKKMLERDYRILKLLLHAVIKKVTDSYVNKKKAAIIVKNLKQMEGDKWYEVLNEVCSQALKILQSSKLDKYAKLFRYMLELSLNTKEHFSSVIFDFSRFYQQTESQYEV